jgi:hypothetical protein
MKKAILATLCVTAMCVICLAGTVSAFKTGYSFANPSGAEITADGKWTTTSEWTDSYHDWLYNGWTKTTDTWSEKWEMGGTPNIAEQYLVEVLSDTTSDPNDYFTFCFSGTQDDAATPQADSEVLVNVTHTGTTIYGGTGTGWAPDAAIVLGTNVIVGTSMATSPTSSTAHWIIELKFDKTGAIAGTLFNDNILLLVHVGSTGQTLMWPPMSDPNVPSTWGQCDYSDYQSYTVPEGLTIGVMLTLSTVAVIVSIRYFRKPPKL